MELLLELLSRPGVLGFLAGLVPGLVVAVATFVREDYLDRRRARREDKRSEAAKQAELRREFEDVLYRFLPKFERWVKWEEVALRQTFRQPSPTDSHPGWDNLRELTNEVELLLAELFVKSFSPESHDVVRRARYQADQFHEERSYQYMRETEGLSPEEEARWGTDPLTAAEDSLDRYVKAVGEVLDFHRLDRMPELKGKLWDREASEGPGALGSGPMDSPRHHNEPRAVTDHEPVE